MLAANRRMCGRAAMGKLVPLSRLIGLSQMMKTALESREKRNSVVMKPPQMVLDRINMI